MATLTLRSDLTRPLRSSEVDANFIALNTELATKAPIDSPEFTTEAKAPTPSTVLSYTNPSNITLDPTFPTGDTNIVTTEYFQNALGSISQNIIPAQDAYDTGTLDSSGNKVYKGVDIGSSTKRFANIFVRSGTVDAETLTIGTASLKGSSEGGVVLPSNTAIGDADNVIPQNIASSVLDAAFSAAGKAATLSTKFTFSGAGGPQPPYPLFLNDNGTVSILTADSGTDRFIGFTTEVPVNNQELTVILSGQVTGFSGLTVGQEIFVTKDGNLATTTAATSLKIGKAITLTTLFLYTTSTIDTYVTTDKKLELTDLSISANATPSGQGGLAYNNTTGAFQFTPTKDIENATLTGNPTAPTASVGTNSTQLATTAFVAAEVAALVGSAPATLDTLNEIAQAINNEGNFATTVARKNNTTLTGVPTAPTASSGTNTTQLATTAFVAAAISSLATFNNPTFTGSVNAPTPADANDSTLVATTQFVQTAISQAGIGSLNIDGGVAQTVRDTATLVLDGGGA